MKYSVKGILMSILLGALLLTIVGFVVMLLWNWLIPPIFNTTNIDFFQSIGLLALSRVLLGNLSMWQKPHHHCEQCGGSGFSQAKHHWKEKMKAKMENMTPEEKEILKSQMKNACGMREEVES
jgi:hypothetical protein